jgi:hypothetical protein
VGGVGLVEPAIVNVALPLSICTPPDALDRSKVRELDVA